MEQPPPSKDSAAARFLSKLRDQTGKPTATERGAKMATIEFRCSKTGGRFLATLIRHSANHDYAIKAMIEMDRSAASVESAVHAATLNKVMTTDVDPSDVAWSGWYCPLCDHRSEPTSFVQCGRCKDYVCGGRCRELDDGSLMYACHDKCGGGGKISGTIDSYRSVQSGPSSLDGGSPQHRIEN